MLNIYRISERSSALGPGTRFVIWVQGCLQKCKGCITPQSRSLKIRHLVSIDKLARSIINDNQINGITISGGEPFLQATSLTKLLRAVKEKRNDLNVIVFTGYTIEQLLSEKAGRFMDYIDVLIDGPYLEDQRAEKGLRGSLNQRFHFLTDNLRQFQDELKNGENRHEIVFEPDGTHIIGIPPKDLDITKLL